jgi:hypothetical protein
MTTLTDYASIKELYEFLEPVSDVHIYNGLDTVPLIFLGTDDELMRHLALAIPIGDWLYSGFYCLANDEAVLVKMPDADVVIRHKLLPTILLLPAKPRLQILEWMMRKMYACSGRDKTLVRDAYRFAERAAKA